MDQPSEVKPINLVDQIAVLEKLPEVRTTNEANSSVCGYSGDTELECLKKELVDFDDQIDKNEMISVNNENSSGVGSNSYASSDMNNGPVHSFSKNIMKIEHSSVTDDTLKDVNNVGKLTFDGTLKSVDLIDKDEFSGNVNSQSNFGDLTVNTGTLSSTVNSVSNEEINFETNSASIAGSSKSNKTGTVPMAKFTEKIKLRESNPYDFVVPFIGKQIDLGDHDDQSLPINVDLAKAINERNFQQNRRYVPKMTFHEYIKVRQSRTKEDIEMEDKRDERLAVRVGIYVMKNLRRILLQMQKDDPDETAMIKYFIRFLKVPVTPLAMIHIPQFVHTVMYVRACPRFSSYVRRIAQRCFEKIHVLFPIPAGYNFETVYTNEVQKCLPEGFDGMYDFLMVYDDIDSADEDEDSAFSDDGAHIHK